MLGQKLEFIESFASCISVYYILKLLFDDVSSDPAWGTGTAGFFCRSRDVDHRGIEKVYAFVKNEKTFPAEKRFYRITGIEFYKVVEPGVVFYFEKTFSPCCLLLHRPRLQKLLYS